MSFETAYTPLLQFLKTESFKYEAMGNTRTTLFFDEDTDQLVAFCATKCSSIKTMGDSIFSLCPTLEIAVLCVDNRFRYMGIGQSIFDHLFQQIYHIKRRTGLQLVTLFAIPDAVAFYQKLNFRKLSKSMKILYSPVHKGCVPMYYPLPPQNLTDSKAPPVE